MRKLGSRRSRISTAVLMAVAMALAAAMALAVAPGLGQARTPGTARAAVTFPPAAARTGDWEVGGAAHGSFQIVHKRIREIVTIGAGRPHPMKVTVAFGRNLVLSLHENCRTSAGKARILGTLVLPQFYFPLSAAGAVNRTAVVTIPKFTLTLFGHTVTFGAREATIRLRGEISRSNARLTFSFGSRTGGYCTVSPTSVRARPSHRRTIVDGEWSGTASNGEPVAFGVVAGGRAIAVPLQPPGAGDPAQVAAGVWAFRFGQGCTDVSSSAGTSFMCSITQADGSGWPVDPCVHGTSNDAPISSSGAAALRLSNIVGTNYPATTGPPDAAMKIHFTGARTARGSYEQPGDPACSATFTAHAS